MDTPGFIVTGNPMIFGKDRIDIVFVRSLYQYHGGLQVSGVFNCRITSERAGRCLVIRRLWKR